MHNDYRFDTLAVQAGYVPKPKEPRVLPLAQSTTFFYDDPEQLAHIFDLAETGHMYSRISNPTVEAFENKIAALEGGVAAVATSSGQAATTNALLNIVSCGEHIVASSALYGGSYALLAYTFKKLGIEVTFIDPEADADTIKAAFRSDTKALFAETISNPGMNVLDFGKFAAVAEETQVPLIVDNTFPTPYLCRPLELGAHIVIHSTSKYIDGHAAAIGGIIIDGGKFDWNNGRYPGLTDPDPSYHGISYTESFGPAAYAVKARVQLIRDFGNVMSPFTAFLLNTSSETLGLRMEKHSQNALALAEHLEQHPRVSWVNYPGLKSHPGYPLKEKYMPKGASGVLTFGLKGGLEACRQFQKNVKLAALVVHLGDSRTSILHPATTTHRQLSEAEQLAAGVSPDLIRVSAGLEDIQDLIADFDQAIAASQP